MSRINRYQDGMSKFLKTKSIFIKNTTEKTKQILIELLELSDHIPAILSLTILNNQCKKYNLKIHGYYLAAGIDIMMLMAKVCSNRHYFNNKYGSNEIDNMIMEVHNWFYYCIAQNIETLRISKNGKINSRIPEALIEYAAKYLPLITRKIKYFSNKKMKKTDIYFFNFKEQCYNEYKKKFMLDRDIILSDIYLRYGSVCKLAICLGWLLGQGEEQELSGLEQLGAEMGIFLKIYDDFKYIERDMVNSKFSLNFVVNYGIKEAYNEMTEAKSNFIEGSMKMNIDTRTSKEIIDLVVKNVNEIVKDVSVDVNTQYDDVSSI